MKTQTFLEHHLSACIKPCLKQSWDIIWVPGFNQA